MPDEVISAVRTIREDDDSHVIEGLAFPFSGPFRGKDSYGTTFSARTNFHWDMFPDSEAEPKYTRPVTYQHGFDDEIGLRRLGGWSPVRTDEKGVWVQAQLDKHSEYYGAIRELLDKDSLAFSGGSAEHSVRIDRKAGEILEWPAYELALTPTPSNPFAFIASRSDDIIHVIEAAKEAVGDEPPAAASIEAFPEATRAGRKISAATEGVIRQCISALEQLCQVAIATEAEPEDTNIEAPAERSAEPLTVHITGRETAPDIDLEAIATRAASEEVQRLLRR